MPSFSDNESYFETISEAISTIPSEVRRNLDHIRDLDRISNIKLDMLRSLQQEFILRAEKKILQLEVIPLRKKRPWDEACLLDSIPSHLQSRALGVKVISNDLKSPLDAVEESSNHTRSVELLNQNVRSDVSNGIKSLGNIAVVPTTDELMEFVMTESNGSNDDHGLHCSASFSQDKSDTMIDDSLPSHSLLEKIIELQNDCIQRADEKVAVAKQTYHLIRCAHVARLDIDIASIEKMLQASGDAPSSSLLAGGGVAPSVSSGGVVSSVDNSKSYGIPGDLAACQLTPGSEWILSKVLSYDGSIYTLSDEDTESDKIFTLPETQVIILPGNASRGTDYRVSKGDIVFAIYPDTTSFYMATVVSAPRIRNQSNIAGTLSSNLDNQFVMVNFVDDSDEFGITHDKAVPYKHVMPPPPLP